MASEERESRFVPALGRDFLTPIYDPVVQITTREGTFKRRLLEQAGIQPGMEVLDLGCGTGTLAIRAKRSVPDARLTGLDGDPAMLERAARKVREAGCDVRFDEGMSYGLPYEDASFDRVLSSLFFHHLVRRDKERTLREVVRVLRPGGELHVADFGRPANPIARATFSVVRRFDGAAETEDNVRGRLPELFEDAGLEDVTTRDELSTVYGTLAFYSGRLPESERD
jgi:ubiquinone/menaquinone biosynthesis C-methylase UbiE